jgi:hypothetical protein
VFTAQQGRGMPPNTVISSVILTSYQMIADLASMVKERLLAWNIRARKLIPANSKMTYPLLPAHILFYRDGVSESQYMKVRGDEIPQISKGWDQAVANLKKENPAKPAFKLPNSVLKTKAKIVLVVVTKRHHTRIFENKDSDKNIPHGSAIDSKTVAPNWMEFYLQSHYSLKGIARSSYHIVLETESKYTMEALQKIVRNILPECTAANRQIRRTICVTLDL